MVNVKALHRGGEFGRFIGN